MPNARQIRGGFPEYGYKAQGAGLRKGVLLVIGAANYFAKLANAVGLGRWRGIQVDEGQLPDGSADATLPDSVTAQKTGIAQALVPAASSAAEGDQAWSNANGLLVKRTPFSFSGFVVGQFDETFVAGANPEYRGVELIPHYIECIRQVTGGCTGVIGAATKYLATPGQAVAAGQIALYRARFDGEVARNLSCNLATAPGGADTVAFTVQKSSDNGATWVDTALTASIAAAAKTATDLAHAVALAAGDLLAIKAVSSAGTAAAATATLDVT